MKKAHQNNLLFVVPTESTAGSYLTTFNFMELITNLIKIYTITQHQCFKYKILI